VNCARLRQTLDAWLDGEIDSATGAEIEQHVLSCAACAALRDGRTALREQIREHAPYHRAPVSLRRAVRRSIEPATVSTSPRRGPTWAQAGAALAAAALLSAVAGFWAARPVPDDSLQEQVAASHVASLAASGRLVDVGSGDRHVVKPWFQGRVEFAPQVRDLSADGFVLVGGRLDHIGGRQAVAVVYRVRNHVINLFAWRTTARNEEGISVSAARGFNLATWEEAGLHYAAISDVDPKDLERFARLMRARP